MIFLIEIDKIIPKVIPLDGNGNYRVIYLAPAKACQAYFWIKLSKQRGLAVIYTRMECGQLSEKTFSFFTSMEKVFCMETVSVKSTF